MTLSDYRLARRILTEHYRMDFTSVSREWRKCEIESMADSMLFSWWRLAEAWNSLKRELAKLLPGRGEVG